MLRVGHLVVSARFIWYDFWIGAYYDRHLRWLYVCLLPCCVLIFRRGRGGVGIRRYFSIRH